MAVVIHLRPRETKAEQAKRAFEASRHYQEGLTPEQVELRGKDGKVVAHSFRTPKMEFVVLNTGQTIPVQRLDW